MKRSTRIHPPARRLPGARWIDVVRRLVHDRGAISAVEFALLAPLMTTAGLGGIELANLAMTYTRVSQVAIQVADNTSRAKQATGANGAMMREHDVNDAFAQVDLVYPGLDFYTNGRVIVSSLEQNSGSGQWVHWQRCRGAYSAGVSKYGVQGTGASGTAFAGMGPAGNVVTADSQSAIMFVEVYYRYRPVFFTIGSGALPVIYRAAAMYVRDDRDLAQLYNPAPTATSYTCS